VRTELGKDLSTTHFLCISKFIGEGIPEPEWEKMLDSRLSILGDIIVDIYVPDQS
jgi:hypothetical protein